MEWRLGKVIERLRSVITRGHVTRIRKGEDIRPSIHYQYHAETDANRVDYMQPAGFCSRPKPSNNVEVITVDPWADPSHRVAIVVTAAEEPDCPEGEACLYAPDDIENKIKVNGDGICLEANGQELIQTLITMASALNPPQPTVVTALQDLKC